MLSPKKQSYKNLANSLIEKFNMRGIEGYYCDTKEEAEKLIRPGDTAVFETKFHLSNGFIKARAPKSEVLIYDAG